ncbi:hypothetical protein KIW84_042990 [Lathyrus oleraceus]|uniref:NAF domain-containing protein n=1 Tax=Pisum sativum TaxID=3888 RepID=A0A9D5ATT6_PEA|nr:hypothetical protein KIW84_042990 [Pisum sativum]
MTVNLAATVILPFSLCCNSKLFSWSQTHEEEKRRSETPICINAFELIGMSSSLDLSGLFENEDVSERKIRFTTNLSAKDLMKKIEDSVADMEFRVQKKNGKIKVIQENKEHKTPGSLSVTIEDYEDILLPTDEQWPFLLRFPIGCFGICLGLSSQAVLWHNLATSPATRFLHITPNISFLIWLLALAVLIVVSITYILKCIFYFHSTLFST